MTITNAFVIVAGCGEYSGRCERPFKVYTNKLLAMLAMSVLDGIASKYEDSSGSDAEVVAAKAEYAAAGFADRDDWQLSVDTDWALHEVELVT